MTNWPKLIIALHKVLGSDRAIADIVGGSTTAINELRNGVIAQPRPNKVKALIALYRRVCK